jgi:hypothetical protein
MRSESGELCLGFLRSFQVHAVSWVVGADVFKLSINDTFVVRTVVELQ